MQIETIVEFNSYSIVFLVETTQSLNINLSKYLQFIKNNYYATSICNTCSINWFIIEQLFCFSVSKCEYEMLKTAVK